MWSRELTGRLAELVVAVRSGREWTEWSHQAGSYQGVHGEKFLNVRVLGLFQIRHGSEVDGVALE